MEYREIYDVTTPLRPGMPVWPGDAGFIRNWPNLMKNGAIANCSRVELGSHTGTHMDSPWHFLDDGAGMDAFDARRLVLPATVLESADPVTVRAEALAGLKLAPGEAVLFKTPNSHRRLLEKQEFSKDYVAVSAEAAAACLALKVSLVGIDYLSVDGFEAPGFPAHMLLLKANVLLLEGLDLLAVPPGRYLLAALPLKLAGVEAAPVRAVLMR